MKRKLISIVVPVFNEKASVEPLYHAVTRVMLTLADRYDHELIITDNHSEDGTFTKIENIASQDRRVRIFRFSRNFGFQRSISTGYARANGDAAIQLDCDMQDPPELIPEFIRLWEEGYKVVYGVRRARKESRWISSLRKIFYRLIDFLSEDYLPHDAGDFRLVDRRVLEELKKVDDNQPYLRGEIAVMGFNQIGVPYDRSERVHGESKFSFGDLLGLAVDGILNHSIVPLRIATFTGLAVSFMTFLGIIVFLAGKIFFGQDWPAGFATTTVLILLSVSLNALFLGIIGEYLGRLYKQVKRRPRAIIEKEINANDGAPSQEES